MLHMSNYALIVAAVGTVALYAGWREYAGNNRRDGLLIAAFGVVVMLGAVWIELPDLI